MKVEKDELPPVVDCRDCVGNKPYEGNATCAGCIARQMKASAVKSPIPVEA